MARVNESRIKSRHLDSSTIAGTTSGKFRHANTPDFPTCPLCNLDNLGLSIS
jgi:hypothetical protein